jgi:hypothetical protein
MEILSDLFTLELKFMQLRIQATCFEQFFMFALLHDCAFIHYKDHIGAANS